MTSWLEEKGIQSPARSDLVRWLDARMRWSSSTQYTATIAARGFFRWRLGREQSPAEGIPLPRRSYQPQRSLDEKKVMRVLLVLDTSTVKGRRDTCLILLMLDSGLRAAEVCRLQLRHIDFEERRLTVRIKGGRWADGVFCSYTASSVSDWLPDRERIAHAGVEELFVGVGGETPGRPMTPSGLRAIFRQIGKKAGFELSPHDLRRTFAHLALKAGAPTRVLQVAGRWNSIKQVETYSADLTADDFNRYSPVAKVMGLRVDEPRE
jgi:integrase/recombinase XerD